MAVGATLLPIQDSALPGQFGQEIPSLEGAKMLEGLTPPAKAGCKVQQVADTLEPKDQEILKQSVMNPDWPISTLSRELQKRGITLGEKPITAHRKGHCQCSKT